MNYPSSENIDSEVLSIFRDATEAWGNLSVLDNASLWGVMRNIILEDPEKNMEFWVEDLQNMPVDQIQYVSDNGKRQDVRLTHDNIDRGNKQVMNTFVYPKNEISYLLWNRNPYEISRGTSGRAYPGTCFSYAYWLARWNLEGRPDCPPIETTTTETVTEATTETSTETTTNTSPTEPITTTDPITASSPLKLFTSFFLFICILLK